MKVKIASLVFALCGSVLTQAVMAASGEARHVPHPKPEAEQWYYLSSNATDRVFRFEHNTGKFLGVLDAAVPGPFASFVANNNEFIVAAQDTGAVYRFNGETGAFIDVFVKEGSGGLSNPTAPIFTPDRKYLLVGDLDLNGYYRYDGHTGEYIDIFADASSKPIDGPFMPVFSPWPEMKGKVLIASGFSNSIQIYDIESSNYEGDFVKPNSGGLSIPIGLVFGPDGNLYTSGAGCNCVKRYNGRTGEYIDDFVPSGGGGLKTPRALEFGGSNGDLHVVSNDTNNVLKYDRETGKFLGVSASGAEHGFADPRGLMFSLRPFTFIAATPAVVKSKGHAQFRPVTIDFYNVRGGLEKGTHFELVSIEGNDPLRDLSFDIKGASYGKSDRKFMVRSYNDSAIDRVYTVTYRISRDGQPAVLATTKITVPSSVVETTHKEL